MSDGFVALYIFMLAAIAGPNNVGKSTLFNALVGAALSPAPASGWWMGAPPGAAPHRDVAAV